MFKKSKKHKHIALQITIGAIVTFFWVIPGVFDGPAPAELLEPGFDNAIDVLVLFNKFLITAKQIFTTTVAATVTIIGGIASIAAAIWAFKKK